MGVFTHWVKVSDQNILIKLKVFIKLVYTAQTTETTSTHS